MRSHSNPNILHSINSLSVGIENLRSKQIIEIDFVFYENECKFLLPSNYEGFMFTNKR